MTWTEEQQKVIDTRNCDILVSAAAGSGKTAVLVARILAMVTDPEHPVDIDRLLVVTFTNAAAAEMRQRIRDALEERAEAEPENAHLQRQLVLIHNAKITTIHSFCLQVLRSHFHLIGIDPAFRVADEGEVLLLKQDVLKETLDAAYEDADEEFFAFLEQFAPGRDDKAVADAVLELYHFSLGQPWPEEWLRECRERYEKEPLSSDWLDYAQKDARLVLLDVREQIRTALEIAGEPDGPYPYIKALEDDYGKVERLLEAEDYEALAKAFAEFGTYQALGRKKDDSISEEKKQQVQDIRASAKDMIAAVRKQYFYDRPEILKEEFWQSGLIVRELTRLTEQFAKGFAKKKAEKNILDFSDLEHFALQVLVRRENGETIPTAAAEEYAEQFEEIMIDEYQDSNLVQEILLGSVAGKGQKAHNRFMVGDVKQSIYRFRLARPELFLEKYQTYQTDGTQQCRIDLHKNFRSRSQVLDGVNYIFRQIMTENPGGIVYDKDAALYPGAKFGEGGSDKERITEILLAEAESRKKKEAEARMVGRKIQELVGTMPIWDAKQKTEDENGEQTLGGYRPAEYRDIVILLRTVSGWSDLFGEVLSDMGIPCFTGSQKGYFSAAEVRVVLSYLQVLDNPVQDIPLAGVLRSPIGGLTDEELAHIRSGCEKQYFYDCCLWYREEGADLLLREKLDRFFDTLEYFRKKSAYTPVHLLLWEILDVTGYGEYAAALPAGSQRKANLDMLVEKAVAYEATSYRGLYHFVRYIENLKKYEVDYGEANIGTEADNTVRIMSIHKSKGLEFPIVFVSGLGKQFNESDLRSRTVMHPEFGIGCDYVDAEKRLRRPNLLKNVIRQVTASENLGEELRVLYVAMTRAREKLILTGSVTDFAGQMEKWSMAAHTEQVELPYSRLMGASTYLDWVIPALLRHPDAEELFASAGMQWERTDSGPVEFETQYSFQVLDELALSADEVHRAQDRSRQLAELLERDTAVCYDEAAGNYLEQVFQSVYPYEALREIPGKVTVSELKKISQVSEETDAEELYQAEQVVPLIPAFTGKAEPVQGAARGTSYHIFMENLDFSKKEELEIQLEELVGCGKMTQDEADCVRLQDVRRFLESRIGQRMAQAAEAGTLCREQPFVLGVPADTLRGSWSKGETVLVQGMIDAWFEEDGAIVLVDYKTDRVASGRELVKRYQAQLDSYALALERLTGFAVKERVIYSFWLGKEIETSYEKEKQNI